MLAEKWKSERGLWIGAERVPRCRSAPRPPGLRLWVPRCNSCPYSGVSLCVSPAARSTSVGSVKARQNA